MAAITMRDVHNAFGNVHVIKGIDLDIKNKDFIVFVGPSGCGKGSDKPSDAKIKGKAIAVEHLGGEIDAYLDRGGVEPWCSKPTATPGSARAKSFPSASAPRPATSSTKMARPSNVPIPPEPREMSQRQRPPQGKGGRGSDSQGRMDQQEV
jgi:hypothetical protein